MKSLLKPLVIAYAEDDPDDQLTFAEIIKMIPFPVETVYFTNGLSIFHFLQESVLSGNLPDCIILDINMPIWDGIRTLQTIRGDTRFSGVPVIMFTTTQSPHERERCMQLGATAFLTKPDNGLDYRDLVAELTKLEP